MSSASDDVLYTTDDVLYTTYLSYPLFGRLFRFRCMIGNHRLVHFHNVVQYRPGAAVDGSEELHASSPSPFSDPQRNVCAFSGQLLDKAQIFRQDLVHGSIRDPIGAAIFLHVRQRSS